MLKHIKVKILRELIFWVKFKDISWSKIGFSYYILLKTGFHIENIFKAGAPVAYYDNCGEIREGSFLCTGKQFEGMNPIDIIAEVLNSDEEIRNFCKDNNLGDLDDHIFK